MSPSGTVSDDHPSRDKSVAERSQEFFLAEIAIRHMLRRCGTSVAPAEGHPRCSVFAPIVATELESQLNGWYDCLPASMWFSRDAAGELVRNDVGFDVVFPIFLRAQYYSCLISIYWPAAVQAIEAHPHLQLDIDLLNHCSRFFESCIQFIRSASACIAGGAAVHPNKWMLYVRYVPRLFVLLLDLL